MRTVGILLLNLGGPDSLKAVQPFLYNLFSDRAIIRLGPAFLQRPLAYLIARLRSGKTEKMYRVIGGKSPLLDITRAQAAALADSLNSRSTAGSEPLQYRVYIGMRYWHPLIEETVKEIHADGIRRLIALSLYPHYSIATTGSAVMKLNEKIAAYDIASAVISSWYDNEQYVDALVDVIERGREVYASQGEHDVPVLFSAHSLPLSIVESGDPYVDHIKATIAAVVKKLPLKWDLAYQSKTGPVKWLQPTTEEKIRELAGQGVKSLLVVPISFVSDHIETLYEIDVVYRELAAQHGMRLVRTESLNAGPLFIKALCTMIRAEVEKAGWTE